MNSTNVESERYCDYFNTMADVNSDTLPKNWLNQMTIWPVAMTVRRKVDSCVLLKEVIVLLKNQKIQLRSRYDQFISSKYVAVSRLKVHKRFRVPSRSPVKQPERTLNTSWRKRHLLRIYVKKSVPSSSRIHQFTKKYAFYRNKHGKEEDNYKQKSTSKAELKCRRNCCSTGLRKPKKLSRGISLICNVPNETSHSLQTVYKNLNHRVNK